MGKAGYGRSNPGPATLAYAHHTRDRTGCRSRHTCLLCGLCLSLILPGCFTPVSEGEFESENPAAILYAMSRAAREKDTSRIPDIVEQLGSDDPATRFVAIQSLETLTGRTFGYRYYDPPDLRAESILRWVQYVETMEQPPISVDEESA